jgi:uncharacterized phiE125 gp8 family phage protein|tara:strand:+ start:26 stop:604 length:579 start_codon:yes stop_codon:yes gene_type:complete
MSDPVTFQEARLHLRLPSDLDADEAVEILRMISVATEYCENFCNRSFTVGTRTAVFDDFPVSWDRKRIGLYLPHGKVSSITSLVYYTNAFAATTLNASKYRLVGASDRAHLYPAMGEVWPTDVACEPEHIVVTYAVDGSASVPVSVKQAVLLIVGSLFEYREDGVIDNAGLALVKAPKGADDLLSPYRLRIA